MESNKMNLETFNLINFSKSSGRGYDGKGDIFGFPFSSISKIMPFTSKFTLISKYTPSNLLQNNLELGEEMS